MGQAPIIYKHQMIGRHNNYDANLNVNPLHRNQKRRQRMSDFGQVVGDDVMANDMVMDDIVNEMEGNGNNGLLPGQYHKTTE